MQVIVDYYKMQPEWLIVKSRAQIEGGIVTLECVVNVKHGGEVHLADSAELLEGDAVYAEPGGLAIKRGASSVDDIERINGLLVPIASVQDGKLILFKTELPQ
jgi:hypothetical protein